MSETSAEVMEIRAALAAEFRAAVADARARVAAVLEPARPSTEFLGALADELRRAEADPSSVPYPELADPDQYWAVSVQPQAQALREQVEKIIEWLEARVIATMEVAERDLKLVVDEAVADVGPNHVAARSELEAALNDRCTELHHQMAELLHVLPDPGPFDATRQAHAAAMHAQATADVDALKPRYLAEAGGDEAHQRFAEQQWSETYGDRVAHRAAMLAAATPWRHQELALIGYERAAAECEAAVEASVSRLQAPLAGMTAVLLDRFDTALSL